MTDIFMKSGDADDINSWFLFDGTDFTFPAPALPGPADRAIVLQMDKGTLDADILVGGAVLGGPDFHIVFGRAVVLGGTVTANSAPLGVQAGDLSDEGISGHANITIDGAISKGASATHARIKANRIDGGATAGEAGVITVSGNLTAKNSFIAATSGGTIAVGGEIVAQAVSSTEKGSLVRAASVHNDGVHGMMNRIEGGALQVGNYNIVSKPGLGDKLEILDGGTVNVSGQFGFGRFKSDRDSVTIADAGSKLNVGTTLIVGDAGQATLTVRDGASATFDGLAIGKKATGSGFIQVLNKSRIDVTHDLILGGSGSSQVSVSTDSVFAVHGTLSLGTLQGVSHTLTTEGAKAKIVATNLRIGNAIADVDDCGKWTYTGLSAAINLTSGGYLSVGHALTIDNRNDEGFKLQTGSSVEIGGNNGPKVDTLTIDEGGILTLHGRLYAPAIVNQGTIEAKEGTVIIETDFSEDSTGKLKIDDKAVAKLGGEFHGTVAFNGKDLTTLVLESKEVFEASDSFDLTFRGSLSHLADGNTVDLQPDALGALSDAIFSHMDIAGSNAVVTLGSGHKIFFPIEGGVPANGVFNIRTLANGDTGLTFDTQSPKIVTHVKPNGYESNFIDTLIWGWGKWNPKMGPITYHFGSPGDIHTAIDTHGETDLIQCDKKATQAIGWTKPQKDAFNYAIDQLEAVTNLRFAEEKSAKAANIVAWITPTIPSNDKETVTLGLSEVPAEVPGGHLWQYFSNQALLGKTGNTLKPGGIVVETFIHELAHALGLAHPHDGGDEPQSGREKFAGVLDQTPFTIMSYHHGHNRLKPATDDNWGDQKTLGPLDIAALKELYGENPNTGRGNNHYDLAQANKPGEGWSCVYDKGGADTVTAAGLKADCFIDLHAATLLANDVKTGVFLSYAKGIHGGLTIARGVTIEAAIGGSGNDFIYGNDAGNTLLAGLGNDLVNGFEGDDTLKGGSGADTVNGKEGEDSLSGGDGDDDLKGGDGDDRSFGELGSDTLGGGDGNDSLDGGAGADEFAGGAGNDTLIGGAGNDTLFGAEGADVFEFDRPFAGNFDTITLLDAQDRVELSQAIFTKLPLGPLAKGAFAVGVAATQPDDRIIYNPGSHVLFYDPDGVGGAAAVAFARLEVGGGVTAGHFLVI